MDGLAQLLRSFPGEPHDISAFYHDSKFLRHTHGSNHHIELHRLVNFFQAFFIGNKANLNPLLVFLAVLGGIALFGLVGVLFGPLILTVFFTFLHIYELEYKDVLHH